MGLSDLKMLAYPTTLPLGLNPDLLPGLYIEDLVENLLVPMESKRLIKSKLEHACRKLTMMCLAAERAKQEEAEFYSTTIKDAPALFGDDAIAIGYHLEAFIFFARSSLDLASTIFSILLVDKKFDSFNDLVKNLSTSGSAFPELSTYLQPLRDDEYSWLSVLCGTEKGRALIDKVTHQIAFPIDYEELTLDSERESPVVRLSKEVTKPLDEFLDEVRDGVIDVFLRLEAEVKSYEMRQS